MNIRTQRRVRLRVALAAAALIPIFTAGPALAHDAVTDTSPAKDSTVTTTPDTVSLTLSEPPLDASQLNLSTIMVTDPNGTTVSDGKVTVNGPTISTATTKGTNGTYKVLWRTVSSDGHPIEGSYTYTVQDPGQTVPPATAPAPSTPTAEATTQPSTAPTEASPEQIKPNDTNAPLTVGIAALVVAIVGGLFYIARKRMAKNQ